MEEEAAASAPAPKRARIGDRDDIADDDLISRLPDAVLGTVVSLLPTKDGGRTQALARRWRPLWLSAPLNLEVGASVPGHPVPASSVPPSAVTRIISRHPGPVRRFSLTGLRVGDLETEVESWFRSRALANLQELEIGYASLKTKLLPLLRSAATLLVLKIRQCDFPQEIVPAIDFPLLKQLSLIHVSIPVDAFHDLLSGCHALESLFVSDVRSPRHQPSKPLPLSVLRSSASTLCVAKISNCVFSDEVVQPMSFPFLKLLSLTSVSMLGDTLHSLLSSCHALESLFMSEVRAAGFIRVRSPTLRSICLSRRSCGMTELFIEDAPRLVRVLIPYCQQDGCLTIRVIRAPKLEVLGPVPFRTLKNQEILSDSQDFSKFRIFQGMYPVSSTNPMRTVKVLALRSSGRELHAVLNVLRWFPNLEKLSVIFYLHNEKDKKNEPQYDPRHPIECLQTRLKKVVFKSYLGYEKQLDFVRFFILNAKVLSKMEFEGHDDYINNTVTYQHKWKTELLEMLNLNSRVNMFVDYHVNKCIHVSAVAGPFRHP